MLTLVKTGNNSHRLTCNGMQVLFSYETPVALRYKGGTYLRKDYVGYSPTTSRHMSAFLDHSTSAAYAAKFPDMVLHDDQFFGFMKLGFGPLGSPQGTDVWLQANSVNEVA